MKKQYFPCTYVGLTLVLLLLAVSANAQPLDGDDLYLTDPTPGIVFDDTDSAGWNWVLRGRDEFFTLSDEVNADDMFFIAPGDGTNRNYRVRVYPNGNLSLNGSGFIDLDGDVAIEEELISMAEPLAITDSQARIDVYNSGTTSVKTLFALSNSGNTKFEITERSSNTTWAFTNSGTDFRVSLQDSGKVEFSVANNGNATLAGALTQNSDRNAKQAIVPVDTDVVLEKVASLPISQWQYRDEAGVNHLGPMAQDFHAAFGLGATDTGISTLDSSGVALAAIQALAARNTALEQELDDLRALVLQMQTLLAANTSSQSHQPN